MDTAGRMAFASEWAAKNHLASELMDVKKPMSDHDLEEIKRRLAVLEERTERFERIYGEWTRIEEWALSLPEYAHLRPRATGGDPD